MTDEKSKLILIADDERDIAEILKSKLEKSGFNVSFAHDGVEAYQKTLALKPDCILLDVRMPKEDGLTVLRKIRAYRHDDFEEEKRIRKIPVIVLTAAGENMKSLFDLEGVVAYMDKPFDFEVLKSKIVKAVS